MFWRNAGAGGLIREIALEILIQLSEDAWDRTGYVWRAWEALQGGKSCIANGSRVDCIGSEEHVHFENSGASEEGWMLLRALYASMDI